MHTPSRADKAFTDVVPSATVHGLYTVWLHAATPTREVLDHYDAVTDDFGQLQRVGEQLWFSLGGAEAHDFCDVAAARAEFIHNLYPPPPKGVTAEITDGDQDWFRQQITVGHDPHPGVKPLYRICIGSEEPVYATHAQLAALLMAAQQIVQPTEPAVPQ